MTALIAAASFGAGAEDRIDLAHVAFAPTLGATTIPVGHLEFCKLNPDECRPFRKAVEVTRLTEGRWQELIGVNNRFNAEIVPVSDEELYQVTERWAYPDGYGDCEDYALAKRRALIQLGWEPSTLLMTVVREPSGAGHAVLLVRTDRGDLVLDNQDGNVRLWNETPYQFVKRQSQAHAGEWVQINDTRPVVSVASTNR